MLVSKNLKDGKFDDLKTFQKPKVGKLFENGVRNLFFEIKGKEFWRMARGSEVVITWSFIHATFTAVGDGKDPFNRQHGTRGSISWCISSRGN